MSQVLKRLTAVHNVDKSLVHKRSIYCSLHQWHSKSADEPYHSISNSNEWVLGAWGIKSVLKKQQQQARLYHGLRYSPPLDCQSRHNNAVNKPIDSRRPMSILTDLLRRKKKYDEDDEVVPEAKTLPMMYESPKGLTDEEIEAKRNVSRLSSQHQRLVNGQHPYTEPLAWIHHTVRYKQRMFGRYGESSGVNPGVLWPTRDELKDKIEYERVCNPFTIMEMVEKKKAERLAEKEATERRIKEVEEKMAMVDKFREDLVKRQEAKLRESNEATARREKLMDEVRRHFGYTVDSRDEKFQELLAKKEKEQRKSLKEARKLEKQHRILQKLEGKSGTDKAKASKRSTKEASETADDKDDD